MIWLLFQAAALTLVVTEGSIFGRLRTFGPALWRQLVSCSLCLGVWVGAARYVLELESGQFPYPWTFRLAVEVLGFGCVTGILAYTGAALWAVLDHHSGPET